jgi:hypothetical protein
MLISRWLVNWDLIPENSERWLMCNRTRGSDPSPNLLRIAIASALVVRHLNKCYLWKKSSSVRKPGATSVGKEKRVKRFCQQDRDVAIAREAKRRQTGTNLAGDQVSRGNGLDDLLAAWADYSRQGRRFYFYFRNASTLASLHARPARRPVQGGAHRGQGDPSNPRSDGREAPYPRILPIK